MATHAVPVRPTMLIGGRPYPILLPALRDPRLHLAAVIISLQILGQVAFDFDLSIAQILIAIGTCALIEMFMAFRQQHVIMWPASALLTGNGVSFILRVPGTQHGDWWSTRGAWIYAGTAAISILSKYVVKWRGSHVFNPSNIGLVICFLALGSSRVDPLDFWWGPMSPWMAVALTIIVGGGFLILKRLRLLVIAVGFWLTFAAGIGVMALAGHSMTARWHLGPVTGRYFWWVLVTSPEILVFMFFMISDPKTIPSGRVARLVFTVGVGVLAVLLIAPMTTEFQAKVAVLGSLAIACLFRPLLEAVMPKAGSPEDRLPAIVTWARRRGTARAVGIALVGAAVFAGAVVAADIPARPRNVSVSLADTSRLPAVTILHSRGVSGQLGRHTAQTIARSLVADLQGEARALRSRDASLADAGLCCHALADVRMRIERSTGGPITVATYRLDRVALKLGRAEGQGGAVVVALVNGAVQQAVYLGVPPKLVHRSDPTPFTGTFKLDLRSSGYELIALTGATSPPKGSRSRSGAERRRRFQPRRATIASHTETSASDPARRSASS
jgi:Na+-translocating ferredoxin:NAD+ oxidoreductase RnfD subunit